MSKWGGVVNNTTSEKDQVELCLADIMSCKPPAKQA
jgi:hypothetical protein